MNNLRSFLTNLGAFDENFEVSNDIFGVSNENLGSSLKARVPDGTPMMMILFNKNIKIIDTDIAF